MPPEVWGGIEATVVRIGGRWRSQIVETGHHDRPDDLDRIASLGIRTLRYPVLWESVAPEHPDACDWSWHDRQLRKLQTLGIDVIAGLVHHGSGPGYTDLLDHTFGEKLAAYAGTVAKRYPWIQRFTPVNEPLTTARFSALYGHWYPHRRDEASFLRAVVNQCRGIVLAMQAIRRETPCAKLIQTEDLGRTFSSRLLQYQAEFENQRRWLSFDLLCGSIDTSHPLRDYLLRNGITGAELSFFQQNACPPDTLGMNHYPTSERYLDERCDLFHPSSHGGNGRHRYADIEAVRVDLPVEATGPEARLQELWDRYRRPVAITEVHHGSTREEQLRWLLEGWQSALAVQKQGGNVQAVTAWALLGVVDWNSLLLQHQGFYEAGAFDIRSNPPRPTILAKAITSLARQQSFRHPVLAVPGWWRRQSRLYEHLRSQDPEPLPPSQPVLVLGNTVLTDIIAGSCTLRGLPAVAVQVPASVDGGLLYAVQLLRRHQPWAVMDTDLATCDRERAGPDGSGVDFRRVGFLAAACDAAGIPFIGLHQWAGTTDHPSAGMVKENIEIRQLPRMEGLSGFPQLQGFLRDHPRALILDVGFLPEDCLPALSHAALDLLIDGETGLWHLPYLDGAQRLAASGLTFIRGPNVTRGLQQAALSRRRGIPDRQLSAGREVLTER
jgi:dTDP-4-dehydrorhamnose reductase